MNHEELAFFNLQLAGMLRDGLPLEGGIKRLCATMGKGLLRREMELLEQDLAKGTPLAQAIGQRKLPNLYVRMVTLGIKSHDLPGMLTLLADFYQKTGFAWTRLKGLMTYPTIILFLSLVLSFVLGFVSQEISQTLMKTQLDYSRQPMIRSMQSPKSQWYMWWSSWTPPILLISVSGLVWMGVNIPGLRRILIWKVSPFRETKLAQFGSSMTLLLKGGCSLDESLSLVEELENGSPAAREIAGWRQKARAGVSKWGEMTSGSRVISPLFLWMTNSAGEDLATGFERASRLYSEQARHRTEMLLYVAMPVSVCALAIMVFSQLYPFLRFFFGLPNLLFFY